MTTRLIGLQVDEFLIFNDQVQRVKKGEGVRFLEIKLIIMKSLANRSLSKILFLMQNKLIV